MVPFLLALMNDEYDAVRQIAFRSLRTMPGYEEFAFDPFSEPNARARVTKEAVELWDQKQHAPDRPQLLFGPDGQFQLAEFVRLLHERDRRPVRLRE